MKHLKYSLAALLILSLFLTFGCNDPGLSPAGSSQADDSSAESSQADEGLIADLQDYKTEKAQQDGAVAVQDNGETETVVENDPASVENDPAPVENDPAPVEDDPASVEGDPASVEDDPVPVEGDPVPVEGDPVPVEDNNPAEDELISEVGSYLTSHGVAYEKIYCCDHTYGIRCIRIELISHSDTKSGKIYDIFAKRTVLDAVDLAKSEAQIGCVFVVFYDTEMNEKSLSGGKPWRERLTEIEPVDEEEFIAAFCSRLGIYGITDLTVSDFGAYGELVEFNLPSRGSNISDMYLCEDIFDILTDFKEKHPELVGAQFKVIDEENNITALGIVRKYNDGYSDEWTWMEQWPER